MGQCQSRQKAAGQTSGGHPVKQPKSKTMSIFKKKKNSSKRQVQFVPDVTEASSSEAEDNVFCTPHTVDTDLTERDVHTPKGMSLSSVIHSSNGSHKIFPTTPLITLQEDLEDAIPEEEDPEAPSDEEDAHEESLKTPPDEPGRLEPVRMRLRQTVSPESVQLVAPSPVQAAARTKMSKITKSAVAPSTVSHFQRLKLKIQLADQEKKQKLRARKLEDRLHDVQEYRKLYADFEAMEQEAKSAEKPRERSDSFDLKNSQNWYFDFQSVDFAYDGVEDDNGSQTSLSLLSETSMEVQRKYFESKSRKSKRKSRQKATTTTTPPKTTTAIVEIDTTPITRNGGVQRDYGPVCGSEGLGPTDMEVSFNAGLHKDDDGSLISDLADDTSTLASHDYGVVRRRRRTLNPDDTSLGSSSRLSGSIMAGRRSKQDREAFANRLSSLEATVASMTLREPPDIHRLVDENSLPPESNSTPGEFQVLGLAGTQLMYQFDSAQSPAGSAHRNAQRLVSPDKPRKPSEPLYDDMGNRVWRPIRTQSKTKGPEENITTTSAPEDAAVVSPESTTTKGAHTNDDDDELDDNETEASRNENATLDEASFTVIKEETSQDLVSTDLGMPEAEKALSSTETDDLVAAMPSKPEKWADPPGLPPTSERSVSSTGTEQGELPLDPIISFSSTGTEQEDECPPEPEKSFSSTDQRFMPPTPKRCVASAGMEHAELPPDPIISFSSTGTEHDDECSPELEKTFSSSDQDGLPPEPVKSFSSTGTERDDLPPEPIKSFSSDGSELPPKPVQSFSLTVQDEEVPVESAKASDEGVALLFEAEQAGIVKSEIVGSVLLAEPPCVEDASNTESADVAVRKIDQQQNAAVNKEEEHIMKVATMIEDPTEQKPPSTPVAASKESSVGAEISSEVGVKDAVLANADEVTPVKKLFHDSEAGDVQKDENESSETEAKTAKRDKSVKRAFNPVIASMTTEEFLGLAERNPLARVARMDYGDDDIPSDEEKEGSGVKLDRDASLEMATDGHYTCDLSKDEPNIGEETLVLADKVASEVKDVLTRYRSYDDFVSEGGATNPLIEDHEKEKL